MYAETPLAAPWGKLFDAALVREAGLRFDVTMRCYEDRPFVTDYLRAFFTREPKAECLFINRPLYYYENGISDKIVQDFGDYRLLSTLTELRRLPDRACQ